jgi:3-oxoacyl-[acyl-carrier-protein] synthase-3
LTIVSELQGKLTEPTNVVMCGFGAGLSWGTAFVPYHHCQISTLIEY